MDVAGTAVPEEAPIEPHCSRCGAAAAEDANFCTRCGNSLRGSGAPTLADDSLGEPSAPPSLAADAPAFAGAYASPRAEPAWPAAPAFPARETAVHYGGFWRRFSAAVVDGVLVWFVSALVQIAMRVNVLQPDYFRWWPDRVAAILGLLISWIYGAWLMSSHGQGTLGQQVFDLRMTDLAGRRISFARATARHFAEYGSALLLFTGYLPILFHERRQALHDLIAGTLVVRAGGDW